MMSPIRVVAFIDWNSQIHAAKPGDVDERRLASYTLTHVAKKIGKVLYDYSSDFRFDVTLRVYHGWLKGFTVTDRRKALALAVSEADFAGISERPSVSIRPDVQYGDTLMSTLQCRINVKVNCHLPNTLRKSLRREGEFEEKMVDTAIASDIVDLAHREPRNWIVILGEDDDLIPPALVAESSLMPGVGKILLVRARSGERFFNLDGIWIQR